jgi:hypothetical protein
MSAAICSCGVVPRRAALIVASPWRDAKRITAMTYPGAVRNHIHAIAGKNHAQANRKPVRKSFSPRRFWAIDA